MAARGKASNDAEIDRLFDLPPERFTSARDELSNRLKAEGRAVEDNGRWTLATSALHHGGH